MENGILYTFSTIAQALGGAFALLSAFVLFKFQSLKESMHRDADTLSTIWVAPQMGPVYTRMIADGDYEAIADLADSQVAGAQGTMWQGTQPAIWGEACKRLRDNSATRKNVSSLFKRSAVTTGCVMIGSVAAIPLAHPVHCVIWLACAVLATGVGGFALCLFQYWSLIKAAVYDP